LVNKTIFHLLSCGAHGTVIVPKWKSTAFWPVLFDKNRFKREFILDSLEINEGQDLFVKGVNAKCVFSSEKFKSKVLAIKL
jgi:hypothetical protein